MDRKQEEINKIDYFDIKVRQMGVCYDIFYSYYNDPEMRKKYEAWLEKKKRLKADKLQV